MKERIEFSKEIVSKAGRELYDSYMKNFQPNSSLKQDKTLVTDEDQQIERQVSKALLDKFTNDGFLGEEGNDVKSESGYTWVLDPIDGTTNYIYRIPNFTISLALVEDMNEEKDSHKVVGGIVYIPTIDKLYYAYKGGGFCNDFGTCTVSATKKIEDSMTIYEIAHKEHLLEINRKLYEALLPRINKIRMFGSISYSIMQVANGIVDAVINYGTNAWDVDASVLMVREAGGVVLGFDGKDWTPKSVGLVATNRILADQYIKLINETLDESELS